MKTVNAALLAYLNSDPQSVVTANLYEFALASGAFYRYTDFDFDIVYGGNTYAYDGPVIHRTNTKTQMGLSVATMSLDIEDDGSHLIEGVKWVAAIANDVLYGASVTVHQAFLDQANGYAVIDAVHMFEGKVSDRTVGRYGASLSIRSAVELLNIKLPRNKWGHNCIHRLFDTGCALSMAAYEDAVIVVADAINSTTVVKTNTTQTNASYFNLGMLVINSGAMAGERRAIRAFDPSTGAVWLNAPLAQPLSGGESLSLYPGCDKYLGTCSAKFNNLTHFKGMPYIPQPETIR